VISMWHTLRGSGFDLDIDIEKMLEAEEVFKECMREYFLPPEAKEVEPMIPFSPMPGGALTANTQMLRDNHIMDKYPAIIRAMREVVSKGGFGTSVTPVSQFYFQQAFNNVMFGPWEKIADGYGKMVLGYFGRTPCPPDPDVVKICAEQMGREPTTRKVLEINDADPSKGVAAAKKLLSDSGISDFSDENIFIAATCGQKGIDFLLGKAEIGVRLAEKQSDAPPTGDGAYTVTLNGTQYAVELKGDTAMVNGRRYDVKVADGVQAAPAPASDSVQESADSTVIKAQMPGRILKLAVAAGDIVKERDVLLIIEAMKMEVEIKAPVGGIVSSVSVKAGEQVRAGQDLASIN